MDKQILAKPSLVLIGMPGAGKSTLGRELAKDRNLPFIDTDRLIEKEAGKKLQQLLDELGYQALRRLEGEVIANAQFPAPSVIATGGSAVYSPAAMSHLKQSAVCVFLAVSLATIRSRVRNIEQRGFACAPGQSLDSVYDERQPLYQEFADVTLHCDGLSHTEVLTQLRALMPQLQ